jgi:hypothetical protein
MGSLLLPEAQEKRLDAMRKDTLDRIDSAARGLSTASLVGAGVTAVSTFILIRNAYNISRGR